jgi:ferritin-like metal-binding protein YciE
MKMERLERLLQEELSDIYRAWKQLVKALPKTAKAARSGELKQAIQEHLEVTKGHVRRREQFLHRSALRRTARAARG